MEIRRDISTHGTFAPRAVNLLPNLPPEALFYTEHQTRHPDSIYSISLDKIGHVFKEVLLEYRKSSFENLVATSNSLEVDNLLRLQIELLRTEQEYLEDCFLILRTLVDPKTQKKKELFHSKYVFENKLPGARKFSDAIIGVRDSLKIANKLKHNQGILRGVGSRRIGRFHLGYFLEEPVDRGVMGVSKDIHPNGGAFSFARDLSQRLFDVYFCSEKLCDAVNAAVETLHGIKVQETLSTSNNLWQELASLASEIENNIFSKESGKLIPKFYLSKSSDKLTIDSNQRAYLPFQNPETVTFSTKIDRYNNSFRVPML